jgi:hypothetical protein
LQDDDELKFAMEANTEYAFEFNIIVPWNENPDFKCALNGPAGYNWLSFDIIYIYSGDNEHRLRKKTAYEDSSEYTFSGTNPCVIKLVGSVSNGANAGNLVFRWAQANSSGTAAVVQKGSSLVAYKET